MPASCGGPAGPPPDAPPPHPNSPFARGGASGTVAEPSEAPKQKQRPPVLTATEDLITLEALRDVWVLVQDAQGVEMQWQNLREGERMPVAKKGPISITYSNGKALRILDREGRSLMEPKAQDGIAILRLP
ncbi:MAG: RodZ domain-containing protein [Opitutales bacterium]